MTLTGTDPVTEIPGVGKSTAQQMNGTILVRDFVLNEQVDHRLPSKKKEAAQAIRTADIDPFDNYDHRDIMLAKFRCAHSARLFDDTGTKNCSLHDAVHASPYPCWGVLGDRDWTPLPSGADLTVTPTALVPAHYRTPGDTHKAVYIVTTESTVSDPNGRVQNPASGAQTDTIIPARELDLLLDIFDKPHGDMLSAMNYEQDSPLHIRDPNTGVEALLPTATCPNRSDQALQWSQTDHDNADTTIYTLPLE